MERIRRKPKRFCLSFGARVGFAFWDTPSRTGRYIATDGSGLAYDLDQFNPSHKPLIKRLLLEGEEHTCAFDYPG